jgi:hypothetical protein
MDPFGDTAVSRTGIEHQVDICQLGPAFAQVAADHSDAAQVYDAVVIAKSSGFDIAKRHRRRQLIRAHVPLLSMLEAALTTLPPPKPRGGPGALAGERSKLIRIRLRSAHALSV